MVVDEVACRLLPAMFCPGRDEEEVDEVARRLPHTMFHPGGQAVTRRWWTRWQHLIQAVTRR
jgi:hypothetical protein